MPADIYQLSEYQFKVLKDIAPGKGQAIVLPELLGTDPEDVVKHVSEHRADLEDLIVLGLMEDLTSSMLEPIIKQRIETGRGYDIYGITDIGRRMFARRTFKRIN